MLRQRGQFPPSDQLNVLWRKKGIAWALGDVLTAANFGIAAIAALVGYFLFEFLRRRLDRAISALSGVSNHRKSGKRTLSAAARTSIAKAQRERWRKFKAAKKG